MSQIKSPTKNYKQDYEKRYGFDYDGVLSNNVPCQIFAEHLSKTGMFVCIITKRNASFNGQEVLDYAEKIGISADRVFFTSDGPKSPIVDQLRLTKFYDDQQENIDDINKNTDCKAILIR